MIYEETKEKLIEEARDMDNLRKIVASIGGSIEEEINALFEEDINDDEKARRMLDLINNDLGSYSAYPSGPANVTAKYSPSFLTYKIIWQRQNYKETCSGVEVKYYCDTDFNGFENCSTSFNYYEDDYHIEPDYFVYRVIDGNPQLIQTIRGGRQKVSWQDDLLADLQGEDIISQDTELSAYDFDGVSTAGQRSLTYRVVSSNARSSLQAPCDDYDRVSSSDVTVDSNADGDPDFIPWAVLYQHRENDIHFPDINGDGYQDLVEIDIFGISSEVFLGSSDGYASSSSYTLNTGGDSGIYTHHFADINGDGKDDLIQFQRNGTSGWIAHGQADGTLTLWTGTIGTGENTNTYRHHFADINGDGRDDLIQFQRNGTSGWIAHGQADGTLPLWTGTIATGENTNTYRHHFADINGDGKDDLIQFQRDGAMGWIAHGQANGTLPLWTGTVSTGEAMNTYTHHFADINGDGRDDLIQLQRKGVMGWIALGQENGTLPLWTGTVGTGESTNTYRHYFADINGDGRDDLIQLQRKGVMGWIALGQAAGTFSLWSNTVHTGENNGVYSHYISDYNQDGKSDLIQYNRKLGLGWTAYGDSNGGFSLWSSSWSF